MPNAGKKMMYTSGWPKNQKMCCHSRASPSRAGMNHCMWIARSAASISVLPAATAGIANTIMNATTSCAHTKSGMRSTDMPGARILNTVTMMLTAAHSAAISVNVTSWAHTSTRCPGAYSVSDNGTYANQPVSGAWFVSSATYNNPMPTQYVQYPNALSRGKATLRAPTMSGTKYSPIAVIIGTAKRNIIVVPCVVKIWL